MIESELRSTLLSGDLGKYLLLSYRLGIDPEVRRETFESSSDVGRSELPPASLRLSGSPFENLVFLECDGVQVATVSDISDTVVIEEASQPGFRWGRPIESRNYRVPEYTLNMFLVDWCLRHWKAVTGLSRRTYGDRRDPTAAWEVRCVKKTGGTSSRIGDDAPEELEENATPHRFQGSVG